MQSFIQFHYKENLGQRRYILNTFKLYQEKATIPFIARYKIVSCMSTHSRTYKLVEIEQLQMQPGGCLTSSLLSGRDDDNLP